MPITFLTLYKLYGLMPGGGQPVHRPGFVTKDNVATVRRTPTTRQLTCRSESVGGRHIAGPWRLPCEGRA
jgi:hypothetical protein